MVELEAIVDGARASQLPPFTLPDSADAQVFADPVQSDEQFIEGRPRTTLRRRIAIVPLKPGVLSLPALIDRMSTRAARIFNLPGGTLAVGAPADVVVLDPTERWIVRPESFRSKSRNTPYAGAELVGRAHQTVVRGRIVFDIRSA